MISTLSLVYIAFIVMYTNIGNDDIDETWRLFLLFFDQQQILHTFWTIAGETFDYLWKSADSSDVSA